MGQSACQLHQPSAAKIRALFTGRQQQQHAQHAQQEPHRVGEAEAQSHPPALPAASPPHFQHNRTAEAEMAGYGTSFAVPELVMNGVNTAANAATAEQAAG